MALEKSPETRPEFITELDVRDPFQQWQVVDVQFPSTANSDYTIRHKLQASNPHDIHYRVIKQFTGGSVYESTQPGTKQWTSDYIVLRSDFGNWTGRLLLGTLKTKSFNTLDFTIPNTTAVDPVTSVGMGIAFTVDGQGSTITTGIKNSIRVPFDCTITSATLMSCDPIPTSGSIVIDVYKDVWANFPPTSGDSITSASPPAIASSVKSEDTTLAGWTTSITSGDVLTFEVLSVTSLTRVTLVLAVTQG